MNNQETFHWAVAVLEKAYMNNTLMADRSCGCAVGNLLADHQGYKVIKLKSRRYLSYQYEFEDMGWELKGNVITQGNQPWYMTLNALRSSKLRSTSNVANWSAGDTNILPRSFPYKFQQIDRIEEAFESAYDDSKADKMYDAMMAVVDVLSDIHGINLETTAKSKSLFTPKPVTV